MTTGRPTVLVLMGGPDAERPVSLMSGREVAQALRDRGRHRVLERVIERVTSDELRDCGADVIFPVVHGPWGEGGPLQEILEETGVAYVGSGPASAALAMDKLAAKRLVSGAGVPTPAARRLEPGDRCDLEAPVVLKPLDDGSSIDLHLCRTAAEVAAARSELHPRRGSIMAEQYIPGREVTAGIVLGCALPLVEITPPGGTEFYDYQAKYHRDDTRYAIAPELPDGSAEACTRFARIAFERLGCRDLARADFIVDKRGPWFLEINTMPGFTRHSLVPMAAASLGIGMPALCASLADAALARGPAGPPCPPRPCGAAAGRDR